MNIKVLMMEIGLMVTINQRIDMETIELVVSEFGFNVKNLDIYIICFENCF